jgi:hypothetical protein
MKLFENLFVLKHVTNILYHEDYDVNKISILKRKKQFLIIVTEFWT